MNRWLNRALVALGVLASGVLAAVWVGSDKAFRAMTVSEDTETRHDRR